MDRLGLRIVRYCGVILCMAFLTGTLCAQESCANALDDDGDGLIDLNDTIDCACAQGMGPVQPLLPNPSFELFDCNQFGFGQVGCAEFWEQTTLGTSDYYNGMVTLPLAPEPYPSGTGIIGAFYMPNFMEYIGGCLPQPLLQGITYSLDISIAAIATTPSLSNAFPMNFSPVEFTIYGLGSCPAWPLFIVGCPVPEGWSVIGSAIYTPDTAWGSLNVTFSPSFDVTAIMFGSPCTLPADYPDNLAPIVAYFLYDDAVLTQVQPTAGITQSGGWCTNDLVLSANVPGAVDDPQWYNEGVALVGQTDLMLDLSALGLAPGEYQFSALVGGECVLTSIVVEPPDIPVPSFSASPLEGCAPITVNFMNLTSNVPPGQLIWSFGDGGVSTEADPMHTYASPGTYDISLTVTTPDGCTADTTVNTLVQVFDVPEAAFTFTPGSTTLQPDVQFYNASSDDVVSWSWSFGTSGQLGTSTDEDPLLNFPSNEAGNYPVELVVTNALGCTDTIRGTITIDMNATLYLPNAFTPDGDGINDIWVPRGVGLDPDMQVLVFDRWGIAVVTLTADGNGWNGEMSGGPAPIGVYAYRIHVPSAEGDDRVVLGHVTLVR